MHYSYLLYQPIFTRYCNYCW